MIRTVLILALFAVFAGIAYTQLITPFQVCEMRCINDKSNGEEIESTSPIYTECRDYCLKHAYDHFGNLGTLG